MHDGNEAARELWASQVRERRSKTDKPNRPDRKVGQLELSAVTAIAGL